MTDALTLTPRTISDRSAITVDNVSKNFRLYKDRAGSLKEMITRFKGARWEEFWALRDVSITVPEGSVYGLIGHNGSGKSSLLRIMAGIHKPTKGRVTAVGRISALLELGAGFHPELTGRENVYLNAAILGLRRRDVELIIDEIIEFSGLEEFIDSPVKHYSSGMYVRLGFSVAVHVDPQILIIDEVIAVGDEEFQRRCFEHLYKLRNRGVTIVLVSHSLSLIQTMCDRAAWLDHGHLLAEGPAPEVVHQYLDVVNEREAERFEAEEQAGVAEPHEARAALTLERFEILDGSGRPVTSAITLDPLTIRMHYHCSEPVGEPLFSFAIENETGVWVANPGTQAVHQPGVPHLGDGFIDYHMDRLPLGPGDYVLSFAAHDTHGLTLLDKHERKMTLRVRPGATLVYGLVDLLGAWAPPTARIGDAP